MADPIDPSPRPKWPWLLVIVLLAVLMAIFLFSPSGDRSGDVDDPIAVDDLGEPTTGVLGEGLPGEDELEPVDPDAPGSDTTTELMPSDEPIAAPAPPRE